MVSHIGSRSQILDPAVDAECDGSGSMYYLPCTHEDVIAEVIR